MNKISIHQYLMECEHLPLIDVRSPIEFDKGHIPNAINIPIFTNEERAEIGTIYKQRGQEAAVDRGLAIAGSKMQWYVSELKTIVPNKEIAIHCWRGGKRSSSMAWLFTFVGFKVRLIEKGYKAYRNYVQKMIGKADLDLIVLGGKTGSGKTDVLHALENAGEQIIDLEGLANHKGSAFGSINEIHQPSSEFFENKIYDVIRKLDHSRRIWIENESKGIGRVFIPDSLWSKMKSAPLIHMEIPQSERASYLAATYGSFRDCDLKESFHSIKKRIGGLALNQAVEMIDNQEYKAAAKIALGYYDKTYIHGLETNPSPDITVLEFPNIEAQKISKQLIAYVEERSAGKINSI